MPKDEGLTERGREVVKELNRAGIVIDLSHVGDRTSRDVAEASSQPVSFTHANPRSFCDSPRNKPDDLIRLLASRGGVIGVCCWGPICWKSTETRPTMPNVDSPGDRSFPVHMALLPAGVLIYENVANLGSVGAARFTFFGLPLRLAGATGSPARAVAVVE